MTTNNTTSPTRRALLKAGATLSAGVTLTGIASGGVWAAGSEKPEKPKSKSVLFRSPTAPRW